MIKRSLTQRLEAQYERRRLLSQKGEPKPAEWKVIAHQLKFCRKDFATTLVGGPEYISLHTSRGIRGKDDTHTVQRSASNRTIIKSTKTGRSGNLHSLQKGLTELQSENLKLKCKFMKNVQAFRSKCRAAIQETHDLS